VLDADISRCFDKINHNKLLELTGHKGKIRRQIEAWLKSGNIFEGIFHITESGTPQGGIISPLLSNIALNGMQKEIEEWAAEQKLYRPDGVALDSRNKRRKAIHFIRYADDFVIMHRELEVVKSCHDIVRTFLAERGLMLSDAKTRIVHTRLPYEKQKPGFNFLGFTIKHFNTKNRSALTAKRVPLGYRLLIFPSKDSVKKHTSKIDAHIRRYKTTRQSYIIKKLNPVITGWTNYFKFSHFLTTNIAQSMDYRLFRKLLYWAKRRLQTPNLRIGYRKFWHKIDKKLQFAYKNENKEWVTLKTYREVAKGYSITKYVKIKGAASVYDGNLKYWSKRAINPELKTHVRIKLLKKQKDKCAICKLKFLPGDVIETDHIIPKAKGGTNQITNLQLIHASPCHDYKKE
jgi:RNA-directed DNA polymerase